MQIQLTWIAVRFCDFLGTNVSINIFWSLQAQSKVTWFSLNFPWAPSQGDWSVCLKLITPLTKEPPSLSRAIDGLQCVSCDKIICCRMFLMFLDDDDNIIGVAAAYPLRNVDTITDRCLSCKKEKQNNISRRAKRRKKTWSHFIK